jgi:hypothetical protein
LFDAPRESDVSLDGSRTDDIPQVSVEENDILTTPYAEEEVRKVVFQIVFWQSSIKPSGI